LIQQVIYFAPPLVLAVVLHEIAHGYAAFLLGDPTAKKLGRLSLNPLKHIDPVMTLLLPGLLLALNSPILFGGAKPVPFNPMYFKNPRWGLIFVAAAGPATNIGLAVISFGLVVLLNRSSFIQSTLPAPLLALLFFWGLAGVMINLVLALFNLIPIPPLDGGKIAVGLLPRALAVQVAKLERWGLIIVFALLFSGGISSYLGPALRYTTMSLCNELFEEGKCPLLSGNMFAEENP